jgi:hypothetical protein
MERRPFPDLSVVPTRRPLPHRPVTHLPIDQWPDRVYGYHPLLETSTVICIRRDTPGYWEVAPDINPLARNRAMGVSEDVAQAVIRAAWAPGGHVWKGE